jgi:hypothetical protein
MNTSPICTRLRTGPRAFLRCAFVVLLALACGFGRVAAAETPTLADRERERDLLSARILAAKILKERETEKDTNKPDKDRQTAKAERERLEQELFDHLLKLGVKNKQAASEAADKKAEKDKTPEAKEAAVIARSTLDLTQRAKDEIAASSASVSDNGPLVFIHAGVRLVSPYKTKVEGSAPNAKGTLESAGKTDTANFLEFVYSNRGAWSSYWLDRLGRSESEARGPLRHVASAFDLDTRLTYNFSESKANATAIAGTGEFGGEVTLTAPILSNVNFYLHDPKDWRKGGWSLAPEFSYGVVTNRGAFDAIERKFFGLGYTASHNFGAASDPRWVRLHLALGKADVDTVMLVDEKSRDIALIRGTLPHYRKERRKAFEADVIFPVGKDTHITFGGRVYDGRQPASWSLHLGYTQPIGNLLGALFPKDKESTPSTGGSSSGTAAGSGQTGESTKPAASKVNALKIW